MTAAGCEVVDKKGATIVECLVILAIIATLCALLAPAFMAAAGGQCRQGSGKAPPQSWNLYTSQHDGHWFVKDAAGGVCHHPDCPCRSQAAEAQ